MQNRFRIMILSLVLGFGLVACQGDRNRSSDTSKSPGPAADSTNSPSPTATAPSPGSSSTAMSNSDLENAIKSKLQSDDQLRTAKIDVNANADKKEVTLSGTVPSQDLRTRAVELAKSAQPDLTVTDKIDVKPAA
jgi:osmotically-inducible protein OsmY